MRRHTLPIASLVTAIAVAIAAIVVSSHEATATGWQLATRYTARFSFCVFILIYLLSPLSRVWKTAAIGAALRDRRGLGVGFAGAHFVHLAALIMFFQMSGTTPPMVTLVVGGLAYVFIAAMALTSNDASVRVLGSNWGLLHRIGLHYVWLVFTLTLLSRVAAPARDPEPTPHWIMLGVALLALIFRVGVYVARRSRTRTAAA